ncbi:hypothetical protein [Klebsiella quasipneumoniae]|uniref:hypothetical protein n=1 Tax=Klebsiella quasipneumoniae TaxID=1463165 RepID=UPI003AA49672|nr:hypothetical protein [Klebsiella variicola]HCM5246475.1 hypothetical protein [Klebsiella variicola subsp. variicola]
MFKYTSVIKLPTFELFEDFSLSYLSEKYNLDFTRFGRRGQRQDGIDGLTYYIPDNDKIDVVQCKNYNKTILQYNIIAKDVDAILNSTLSIKTIYYITPGERSSKIQKEIVNLVKRLKFENDITFIFMHYDDMFSSLDLYPKLVKMFFPQFSFSKFSTKDKDIKLLNSIYKAIDCSPFQLKKHIENSLSFHSEVMRNFTEALYSELPEYPYVDDGKSETATELKIFYDWRLNRFFDYFNSIVMQIDTLTSLNFSYSLKNNLFYIYPNPEMDFSERKMAYSKLRTYVDNLTETYSIFLSYIRNNYIEIDI